jgi:methyl-accepting chemotaxis protein
MSFTSIVGSDEKNIVQALKKSLAMIEFDLSGKILDANENFCQALGYELSEIKGKHHRIFVDPKEAASPAYAEFWKKLGRGEYDTAQYKRIAKSGEEIWIEASYNPGVPRRQTRTRWSSSPPTSRRPRSSRWRTRESSTPSRVHRQ